jgi:dCMP deaminase
MRPDWDNYFLGIVKSVAVRQTCDRGRTGCVIVKNNRVLTTGYAGSPPGLPHCDDIGHLIEESRDVFIHPNIHYGEPHQHCIRTIHAEMNAINQAAKYGVSVDGGTLYCSMTPCYRCAMSIISVGIVRVVCQAKYHSSQRAEEMFKIVGIELDYKDKTVVSYSNQK